MRFTPTNEELIVYYLKHKILGKPLGRHMIADMDVYNFEPWDLSSFSPIKSKERQWYFFCPRGTSKKRQTREVNWKVTGTNKTVSYESRKVGIIKTLV